MRKFLFTTILAAAMAEPVSADSYTELNAGFQARHDLDWLSARHHFQNAIAGGNLAPGLQYLAHLDLAEMHAVLNETDLAADEYSASLQLRPHDPNALAGRADAYLALGKLKQAAADLDDAISARPYYWDFYIQRGIVNAELGDSGKSAADVNTMRSFAKRRARLFFSIGVLEWAMGRDQDAHDDFSVSLRKYGDYYSWLWMALADARQGKPVPRISVPYSLGRDWPRIVAQFVAGDATQDEVFAALKDDDDAYGGHACEANFYVGEWLLLHGDKPGARPLLRKAADICPVGYTEREPARHAAKELP